VFLVIIFNTFSYYKLFLSEWYIDKKKKNVRSYPAQLPFLNLLLLFFSFAIDFPCEKTEARSHRKSLLR